MTASFKKIKKPTPISKIVPIDTLFPDPDNLVGHPPLNKALVRSLVKRHTQLKPVVCEPVVNLDDEKRLAVFQSVATKPCDDDALLIRAGHALWEQMIGLGYSHIWVSIKNWSDEMMATEFATGDNRAPELHEWNWEKAADMLQRAVDLDWDTNFMGFQEHEVEPLLSADFEPLSPGTHKDANTRRDKWSVRVTSQQAKTIQSAVDRLVSDGLEPGEALEKIALFYLEGRGCDDS